MSAPNKYGVMNRLNLLESRCTALEQQNAELRTHLWTALETKINDKARLIQDGIRIPQDGKDGCDGVGGATGPQGVRGDVLIPNETELQQAVITLRRKLVEQHAAFLARTIQYISDLGKPEHQNATYRLLRSHLENVLKDLEKLR